MSRRRETEPDGAENGRASSDESPPRWLAWYRRALRIYPREFREEHGEEIVEAVSRRVGGLGALGRARLLASAWGDLLLHGVTERVAHGARGFTETGMWTMGDVWNDLRVAVRGLVRSPGFSTAAILTLVVGIGVNSAMYTVLDAVVLSPLPLPEAERIVVVTRSLGSERDRGFAPYDVLRVRDAATSLQAVGWSFAAEPMALAGADRPREVSGQKVSTGFFDVLGVGAARGRTFAESEDVPGSDALVVLSHDFWAGALGAEPGVLGTTLRVDGVPRRVIGVMPPGFRNELEDDVSVWIPRVFDPESGNYRGWNSETVLGRLAPGATSERLQGELDALARGLADEDPNRYAETEIRARPLKAALVGDVAQRLLLLQGIAAAVLLVACANLANLLLARTNRRRVDLAVRTALGASGGRLARLHLVEGAVLAAVGTGLGLVVAVAAVDALQHLGPDLLPRMGELGLDARALLGTAPAAVGVVVLAPLMSVAARRRERLHETIRAGSRGGGSLLRSVLVSAQVASVMALLLVAGVLSGHFMELLRVDPGFRTDSRWTVKLTVPAAKYPTAPDIQRFFDEVRASIGAIPGVDGVAGAATLPLGGQAITIPAPYPVGEEPEGPSVTRLRTGWNAVSPGYFDVMGIELLRGREFTVDDTHDGEGALIMNRSLARAVFGEADPVGRQVTTGGAFVWQVVGVVGDVRHTGLGLEVRPEMYQVASQVTFAWPTMDLVLRGRGGPDLSEAIRGAVWSIDSDQPVTEVRPLAAVVAGSLTQQRAALALVAGFAGVALVLGLLGIYGVVSYVTSHRTREIGIRMALGARRSRIESLVVRTALVPVALGVALGAVAGWAALRSVAAAALPQAELEPALALALAVALVHAALAAAWLPARRASRADAARVMREE